MSDRNLRIRMLLEAADRFTKPVRQMAAGARAAGRDIAATRERLKALGEMQERIGRFRELRAGLTQTEGNLAAARTKVGELARAMSLTDAPTKKMTAEFARAKREAAELKVRHQAETQELQRLRTQLSAAGVSTSALARHERDLRDQVDRTNRELAEQERRLLGAADRVRRFAAARDRFDQISNRATGLAAGGASGIATGMAMGRPLAGAVEDAAEYEASLTTIGQKADLARGKSQALGRDFLKIARAANQMPAGIRDAVDVLTGFGLSPDQARSLVLPIARTATAYKAEMADLSKATFSSIDNLKVPLVQAQLALDAMALAGNRGAFEIKDMAQYFPALSAGYQALGQKGVPAVADLAAALQITRKGAGDSASAATNLENIINKMQTSDAIKNFKEFGIDLPKALKKAYAEGKTPIEAIAELTSKAVGGDLSKIGFLFGDMQVQAGLRPLIQNMQEYRRIRAEAMKAGGTVDTAFADRMNDSAEKMQRFRVQSQALKLSLGGMLLPTMTVLAEKGAELADKIGGWAERHPVLARNAAIAAAGLAGLFVVAGGGAIAMAGLMAPFAALSAMSAYLGLSLLPLTGIVGGAVLAVGALGAAAYLIYRHWGAVSGFFGRVWGGIKSIFSMSLLDVWKILARGLGYALGAFWKFDQDVEGWLTGKLPGLLASGFRFAWQSFVGAVRWAWNTLPSLFLGLGTMIVKGLWAGIKAAPGAIYNGGKALFYRFRDGFKDGAQIKSPSRVFMRLGGFVMDGLDRGIEDRRDRPIARIAGLSRELTVALAAGGVAAPAMAAAPAARPPAMMAQPPTISISVGEIRVVAAPGQSAADIARAVRDELLRAGREAAVRGRSSYADDPDWRA